MQRSQLIAEEDALSPASPLPHHHILFKEQSQNEEELIFFFFTVI